MGDWDSHEYQARAGVAAPRVFITGVGRNVTALDKLFFVAFALAEVFSNYTAVLAQGKARGCCWDGF